MDTGALAFAKASQRITAQRGSSRRAQVERRDRGVCAVCRLDCDAVQNDFLAARQTDESEFKWDCLNCDNVGDFNPCDACGSSWMRRRYEQTARDEVRSRMRQLRFSTRFLADYNGVTSLWAADHIIPLAEGGEDTVDNLRTLCLPDHGGVTADLRKRMSRDDRGRR
jgi:5-methylcytosine-specific restriction endonuclease McrA